MIYQYVKPEPAHSCNTRFAALLAQVIQYRQQSSSVLKEQFLRCQVSNSPPPNAFELSNILLAEVSEYGNVYIVIDGLDEMNNQTKADFVKRICEFGGVHRRVHCLFTSYMDRPQPGPLANADLYEIRTQKSDLREFIGTQMEDRVSIRDLIEEGSEAKEEILCALIAKAEGLWGFLRAHQHLELIDGAGLETLGDLQDFVKELSPNIDTLYAGLWEQILQDKSNERIAREVLLWLACSPRDLPIQLIQHVVALSRGDSFVEGTHRLLPKKRIVTSCKGLVQTGEASNKFSFNHPTVRAFVRSNLYPLGFKNLHQQVALTCFQYLDTILPHQIDSRANTRNPRVVAGMLEQIISISPLTSFTLENFSSHVHQASELDLCNDFNRVFGSEFRCTIMGMLYLWYFLPEEDRQNIKWRPVPKLHLITAMGLTKMLEMVLDGGVSVDEEDEVGFTALRWSILSRNSTMIEKIYSKGAVLTREDHRKQTTLRWALGDDFCSEEFYWRDITVTGSAQCKFGNSFCLTPRFAQAKRMWIAGVELRTDLKCLEQLVKLHPNAELQRMGTPLMILAAKKQLGSIVAILLEKGVIPHARTLVEVLLGSSNIHAYENIVLQGQSRSVIGPVIQIKESEWRHASIQAESMLPDDQWMCQLITDETLRERGPRNRSALSLAAERGFFHVCKELVARGAVVEEFDMDGWTPLMWAVVSPKPDKIFISNCVVQDSARAVIGVAVEVEGGFQEQEWAYFSPAQDVHDTQKAKIVELFLGHGADPWARNHQGSSVCDKAQWDCLPGVLEVLQRYIRVWTQAYYLSRPDAPYLAPDKFESGIPTLPARGEYMRRTLSTGSGRNHHEDWPQGIPPEQYPNQAAIEVGNVASSDSSRVMVTSCRLQNLFSSDQSRVFLNTSAVGFESKLPKEIHRTVLSLLQLRIENVAISDEARVEMGLLVKDSDTARKEDSVLAKTTKLPDEESDVDDEDHPPKRQRIL